MTQIVGNVRFNEENNVEHSTINIKIGTLNYSLNFINLMNIDYTEEQVEKFENALLTKDSATLCIHITGQGERLVLQISNNIFSVEHACSEGSLESKLSIELTDFDQITNLQNILKSLKTRTRV